MSKLGLVIVMVLMVCRTNAQDYPAPNSEPPTSNEPPTYFVLIQAEDGHAFYARLDNRLYSSSPGGHLILAQLKDSVYTLAVGFPGGLFPEQRYLLNIHQKDWSLRLSRQDNRWSLTSDQGQEIPTAADPITAQVPPGTRKEDAFSQMMAAIVRDTAVMYNSYATSSRDSAQMPAVAIDTPGASPIIRDSTAPSPETASSRSASPASPVIDSLSNPSTTNPLIANPSSSSVPSTVPSSPTTSSSIPSAPTTSSAIPSAPTGVVKLSEYKSTQSLSIVYMDHPADKKTDTIDVIIPIDSGTAVRAPQSSSDTVRATISRIQPADTAHSLAIHPSQSPDTPRSSSPGTGHASKPDTLTRTLSSSHKSGLPFVNSDCHAFASDYDVDKLRVRMLNASKDEDRILVAYKIFKTKCFTTRQVSALSEVFATDAAKFKFLETAYPFVSDDHFAELVSLFSDPIYAGKFRAMTDHH